MSKINISKYKYKFLDDNLNIYTKRNIITNHQYNQIKDLYNVKSINPIQIFTILGAILIGLGVIVYVGSNWKYLDSIFKLSIIIFVYLFTNFLSYLTSFKYKRTSKSILYLGILIYGCGVMLTQSIFSYYINFVPSGLLWILGILPTIYIFEEEIMYIFVCMLTFIFSFSYISSYPYMILFVYALVYLIGFSKFNKFVWGVFARDVLLFVLIPLYLHKLGLKDIYTLITMLIVGVCIRYYRFKNNRWIYSFLGLVIIAICGINLSFPNVWDMIFNKDVSQIIAYAVGISYFIYFISESVRGNVICILPIIALVFRYFSDSIMLSFSKSLLFIIVGGILLIIGFYIEKNINKNRK